MIDDEDAGREMGARDSWLIKGPAAARFHVNWLNDKGETLLHLNARPDERELVLKDRHSETGDSSQEERVTYEPGTPEPLGRPPARL